MRRLIATSLCLVAIVPSIAAAADGSIVLRRLDTSQLPIVRASVTVSGLPEGVTPQLQVSENAIPVQGLEIVGKPDSTTTIVLAIDTSQSMRGAPFTQAIRAAGDFIARKRPDDRVGIVGFGSTAIVAGAPTSDIGGITTALASLKVDAVQGTTLYDAVDEGVRLLRADATTGRRILILLTDGADRGSQKTIDAVAKAATDNQVTIYGIGIKGRDFDNGPIRRLSASTAGVAYDSSKDDLSATYDRIEKELAQTYTIQYRSTQDEQIALRVVATATAADGSVVTTKPFDTSYDGRARATVGGKGSVPTRITQAKWSGAALALIAGLVALILANLFAPFRPRKSPAQLLKPYGVLREARRNEEGPRGLSMRRQLAISTERVLGRARFWKTLGSLIERADLPLRPGELFYMMLGGSLLGGIFAKLFGLPLMLVPAGMLAGGLAPYMFVRRAANKRTRAFDDSLPDVLTGIAASLKAGHAWNQALDAVIREGEGPASVELARAASETRLGRSNDEALEDVAKRIGSADFEFVVMSVAIQRTVGGSLAELLDGVADTVRNRQQFRRKVKALTAMGRASAYVLVALPFLLGFAIFLLNREYLVPLFTTGTGHLMLGIAGVMMSIGSFILKKMVSFKV